MPFQCFDVAARYFEEVFQHLKRRKELIKHVECSGVLVQCGGTEAPEEQAGT